MSANQLTPEQYEMLYGAAPAAEVEQPAVETPVAVEQTALERANVEAAPKTSRRWWPSLLLVVAVAAAVFTISQVLQGDEAPLDTAGKSVSAGSEESVIVSEGMDTVPETPSTDVDTTTTSGLGGTTTIADAAVAEPATAPDDQAVDGEDPGDGAAVGDEDAETASDTPETDTTTTSEATTAAPTTETPTTAATTTQAPETNAGTITITCLDGSETPGVVTAAYASIEEARIQLCGSPESEQWRVDLTNAGFGDDTDLYSSTQIDEFSERTCELNDGDAGAAWLEAATELNLPGADGLPPPVQQVFGEASISAYCP